MLMRLLLILVLGGIAVTMLPAEAQQQIPSDPLGWNRWLVDTRAGFVMQSVDLTKTDPMELLPYDGHLEDGNMLIVLAGAYANDWSHLYHSTDAAEKAGRLLDALATLYLDKEWLAKNSTGTDPNFSTHAYGLAVYLWKDSGAFPPARVAHWVQALRSLADYSLATNVYSLAGNYANPEFYLASGLGSTYALTGDTRYKDAARECFQRYSRRFFTDGGLSYFQDCNPQMGYQGMIVLGTSVYYLMTGDQEAWQILNKMPRYYSLSLHPLGFQPPYESPYLKQNWSYPFFNPTDLRLLVALTGDQDAAAIANAVETRYHEGLQGKWPSFFRENTGPYWLNYHHTVSAVIALRYWQDVKPATLPTRFVSADANHRGGRVVWDNFAGFFTTRPFSATRAGCAVMDPTEPLLPLDSALAFALPEARETRPGGGKLWFSSNERWPHQQLTDRPQIQVMTQGNRLSVPYWSDNPWVEGEIPRGADTGDWRSVETWAVLPNMLVGIITMRATKDGGAPDDWARIRFALYPSNRTLSTTEFTENAGPAVHGTYGKLGFSFIRLAGDDWHFATIDGSNEPPAAGGYEGMLQQDRLQKQQPALVKGTVPWKRGETATLACVWAPTEANAFSKLAARQVHDRISAVAVRLSDQQAYLIVANNSERYMDLQFTPDKEWTVTSSRAESTFPARPLDGIARLGMLGENHIIFSVSTQGKLPLPAELVNRLQVTGGRML